MGKGGEREGEKDVENLCLRYSKAPVFCPFSILRKALHTRTFISANFRTRAMMQEMPDIRTTLRYSTALSNLQSHERNSAEVKESDIG